MTNYPTTATDSAIIFTDAARTSYDYRFCGGALPKGVIPVAALTPVASVWICRPDGCESMVRAAELRAREEAEAFGAMAPFAPLGGAVMGPGESFVGGYDTAEQAQSAKADWLRERAEEAADPVGWAERGARDAGISG